jgi:hypothetical protein
MSTKKTIKKTSISAKVQDSKIPAVLQNLFQKDGRYYLNTPKNFEDYPDLLALQHK